MNLQGLVLFGLYMAGILSALIVSFILKFFHKDKSQHMLLMELPSYRFPDVKTSGLVLLDRGRIFLKRVGGIIFALSILLWFLCTFRSRQKVQLYRISIIPLPGCSVM